MSDSNPHQPVSKRHETTIDRRTVLKGLGTSALASATLTGTASAHEAIGKPGFYGTSKLFVCATGDSGVLMARETQDGFEVGFIVGPNELDPYPEGEPRFRGNYTISTNDPNVPNGQIIGVQIGGTRWVNPNEVAQEALAAEREQLASTHDRPKGMSVGPNSGLPCRGPPTAAPDVPLLNYALTLEHLEYAFYRDGLNAFSDEELMNADALSNVGSKVRMELPGYLETIRDHEMAHVDSLTSTIEKLNGDPVSEGSYDFGYTTPTEFLEVAKTLENTGVAAYAGAAPQIVDNDLLAIAAGIHSVEARHASFLNFVNGTSPFTGAVDEAWNDSFLSLVRSPSHSPGAGDEARHASFLNVISGITPFPEAVDAAKSIEEVLAIVDGFITSEVDPSVYELLEYRPAHDRTLPDETSDLDVLNYALTLEHLENAFYRDGLAEFSDDELMNADVLSAFSDEVRQSVPDRLRTVSDHEEAHVTAISNTIQALGGTPVNEATYGFGYDTPSEFLGIAKTLENTGVAAYAGAALTIESDEIFTAALGIHSVEARHAGFLNELNGTIPFPEAIDEPKSMEEVLEIADQFIIWNGSSDLQVIP